MVIFGSTKVGPCGFYYLFFGLQQIPGGSKARNILTETDPTSAAVTGLVVMSQPGANEATAQKHVRVFRDLQNNWQAHDAYARACLALGTYKLTHALAYYTVAWFFQKIFLFF